MDYTLLNWGLMIVTFAVMIGIGALSARKVSDSDEGGFLLAGRTLGPFVGASTIVATGFSGWGFMGSPGVNALNLTLPYRTYANVACFGAVVGSFCLAGCGIDCGPWRPGYRAMPPMPERCRAGTRRGWA